MKQTSSAFYCFKPSLLKSHFLNACAFQVAADLAVLALLFVEISEAWAGIWESALFALHTYGGPQSPRRQITFPAPILHTVPDVKLINTASN